MADNNVTSKLGGDIQTSSLPDPFAPPDPNAELLQKAQQQQESINTNSQTTSWDSYDERSKSSPTQNLPMDKLKKLFEKIKKEATTYLTKLKTKVNKIKPAAVKKPTKPAEIVPPAPIVPLANKLVPPTPVQQIVPPQYSRPKQASPKRQNMGGLITSFFIKLILSIGLIVGSCMVIFAILYYMQVDNKVVGITLQGYVIDENTQQPLQEVSIYLSDDKQTTTDANGFFKLGGLKEGTYNIKISAKDYAEKTESLNIQNGFLKFTLEKLYKLKNQEKAFVTGKLVSPEENYNFAFDKLYLGEKEVPIKQDGSFSSNEALVGTTTLKFVSLDYKDINKEVVITSGTNQIEDITLTPSGDILGEVKSYIREDLVLATTFEVENVLAEQINIQKDGKFAITDLEIGREYKIRVSAPGYISRDYTVKIVNGENKIFDFRLVEEGFVIYEGKVDKESQFFKSEFDGANESVISDIANLKYTYTYYDTKEQTFYFLSDYEKKKGNTSSNVFLPYKISISDNSIKGFVTKTSDLGTLLPEFSIGKMLNLLALNGKKTNLKLELLNLDGSDKKTVREVTNGAINNMAISPNGQFVYFYETDNTTGTSGFYRYSLSNGNVELASSKPKFSLFDVSFSGNRVIYSVQNEKTGFNDLMLLDMTTKEERVLIENYPGKNFMFENKSEDNILYIKNKESRDNIFRFMINLNKEEKLTDMGSGDTIDKFYLEGDFLFYNTSKGLLILDPLKPKNFKLIH